MKYKFSLSIGFANAKQQVRLLRSEIIDTEDWMPDYEFFRYSEKKKQQELRLMWNDWSSNYIDGGWEEVK